MATKMQHLGAALDAVSLQWLNDNYPDLAEALEREVQLGARPEEVRRYVMGQTQRLELALRCEQAARCIMATGSEA